MYVACEMEFYHSVYSKMIIYSVLVLVNLFTTCSSRALAIEVLLLGSWTCAPVQQNGRHRRTPLNCPIAPIMTIIASSARPMPLWIISPIGGGITWYYLRLRMTIARIARTIESDKSVTWSRVKGYKEIFRAVFINITIFWERLTGVLDSFKLDYCKN